MSNNNIENIKAYIQNNKSQMLLVNQVNEEIGQFYLYLIKYLSNKANKKIRLSFDENFITDTNDLFGNSQIFLGRSVGGEAYATFNSDGSVNLYYNNALKFLTSSTGINLPVDGDSIKFGANSEIILTHVHDVGLNLTGALSITGDGSNATTLTESGSGNFTVDSAGDITLDADGADIRLKDAGNTFGVLSSDGSDKFVIEAGTQDKDIIFKGNDGGSVITALTLDMSNAGSAFFNHDIVLTDNGKITFGVGSDLQIYHDGSNSYIRDESGTGDLIISTDALRIKSANAGETMMTAFQDGAVNLMHNDSTKLSTTSTGVDVTGDLKFNSGYGSSVIGYGVRAWVNFNGTGTVAIRDHGNVSSITDNGTGDYTVNFATALPDTNYCVVGSGISASSHPAVSLSVSSASGAQATGSVRVVTGANGGNGSVGFTTDGSITSVAVIR